MRIGLVFPPPFDLTQPYLSLPMLTSFLRRRGHTVIQRDLNLSFYDHILSGSYLHQISKTARTIAEQTSSHDGDTQWHDMLERAIKLGPVIAEEIDNAKAELRDPVAFYDPRRYARNFRLIHRGCEMLSAVFSPSRITPISFTMGYETESVPEYLAAANNIIGNPFEAIFANNFVPELTKLRLDFIGVSIVYSDQIIPSLTLARLLKAASPELSIIFGGEVFSKIVRLPEARTAELFDIVDGIVLDDGRRPLAALCDGVPIHEIPGIVTRNRTRFVPKMPAPLENLDTFGIPDFSDLPMKQYFAPPHVIPLLNGKGCQYSQCLFCSESYAKDYAPHSVDVVIAAIEKLVEEYGAQCITFADVDIPPPRLSVLADQLIERRINLTWSCYARLTRPMDFQLCEKIARAGCRRIHFGFESASQRILNLMRKGTQVSRVPEILKACWTSGISPHLFSFVGFPGETREEAYLTADFFVTHHQHIGSFNIGAFTFQTFSGIYAEADAFGVESTLTRLPNGEALDHPYRVRGGMDMDEVILLASELAQSAYERIIKLDSAFQIYQEGSNYVCRAGIPPWNSHALAYLRHHGHSFNSPTGDLVGLRSSNPQCSMKAEYVELASQADGSTLIFNPSSAKLLTVKPRFLQLLRSCDGSNSLEQILEYASRSGVTNSHAMRALTHAVREDLVAIMGPTPEMG